jgi:hypothetical protein
VICQTLSDKEGFSDNVCKESDLTKEMLMEVLLGEKTISICELLRVEVETLDGASIELVMMKGHPSSSVGVLKKRMSADAGIAKERMEMYHEDVEGALADDRVIQTSCKLALLVGETSFAWESSGCNGRYTLAHPKKATRAGEGWRCGPHGMVALPPMEPSKDRTDGTYMMSIKLSTVVAHNRDVRYAHVGIVAVKDVPRLVRITPVRNDIISCCLCTKDGKLHANHQDDTDVTHHIAGAINILQDAVITMELDRCNGTLRFWLNGALYAAGFTGIPNIPMQWVVEAPYGGTAVEMVDHPQLDPFVIDPFARPKRTRPFRPYALAYSRQ